MIDKFPDIVTELASIAERFATALDCVDTGFIGDGVLDQLPTGSTLGAARIGGVDLNKPRMRDALKARARPRAGIKPGTVQSKRSRRSNLSHF
jgi:hypothetical protein